MAEAGSARAFAILDEAERLARAGRPILSLSIGEPVEPPPAAAIAAARAALLAGRTRYAHFLGEPGLREAIAAARGVPAAQVVVLPGAQHALLATLMMLLDPGDEVIAPAPHYATYAGTVAAAGGRLIPVAMAPPAFRPDLSRLAAAFTPRTRAILVNTPGNPTGMAIDEAGFAALADLCEVHGAWLISDEVYGRLRFEGSHVSAWGRGPLERTIVLDSLSKSHAMTGFRIGWAVVPEALVSPLREWSVAALFGVPEFIQDAAAAALAIPDAELAPYRAGFHRRAQRLVAAAAAIPGLAAAMPEGGMFGLVDVRCVMADDVAFAQALLATEGVVVLPGSGFGEAARGHVRVALTLPDAAFDEALARLARFVASRR